MIPSLKLLLFVFHLSWIRAVPVSEGPYVPAPTGSRPFCKKGSVTFCEEVEKYPTELIQTLLRRRTPTELTDIFIDEREGLDEPPEYMLKLGPPPSRRKTRSVKRINSAEAPDCPTTKTTATLKAAMNQRGEWKYVVDNHHYEMELCSGQNGSKCGRKCQQMYTVVPMMSLDSSAELTEDLFLLPKNCRC